MLEDEMRTLAKRAKKASHAVATLETDIKNAVLTSIQEGLEKNKQKIIRENEKDIAEGEKKGLSKALLDRLKLDEDRIQGIIDGIADIISLPDPLGEIMEERTLKNGIHLRKIRVPLGVILMIFEARPNVVIDAFVLCFKAGNVPILKGGSDAAHTNSMLASIIQTALKSNSNTEDAIQLVRSKDHAAIDILLTLEEDIDLVIPRGGERLIRSVVEKAKIPVIMHYKGLCHTYIDKEADIDQAEEISYNAKVQRPGVCNAMETLLVHKDIASKILPRLGTRLKEAGVLLKGDDATRELIDGISEATEEDWRTEYLDLILSIRIVGSVEEAIDHINSYGSKHSEAIITEDKDAADSFMRLVDASSVFVNCSTRFNDGFEYGLGAEIGISTQKLHARGPMGLKELTTYKYVLEGTGQVRG